MKGSHPDSAQLPTAMVTALTVLWDAEFTFELNNTFFTPDVER